MSTGITNDNIPVGAGLSYDIASDFNTSGISADVHVPINKMSWGGNTITNRVTELYPLPVQMFFATGGGSTGAIVGEDGSIKVDTGAITITGPVGITGQLGTTYGVPVRRVNGGPVGYTGNLGYVVDASITGSSNIDTISVQGISGAFPVGITVGTLDTARLTFGPVGYTGNLGYSYDPAVTGSVNIDSVSVQGVSGGHLVGITVGTIQSYNTRILNSAVGYTGTSVTSTDFVTMQGISSGYPVSVTGDVAVSATDLDIRDLTSGTDSVSVYSSDGGATLAVNLAQVAGSNIGVSGDALKVAVTNAGLSLQADIGAEVYVMNPTGATQGLIVSGSTDINAEPVHITPDGGSIIVTATNLNTRNLNYGTDSVTVSETNLPTISTNVSSIKNSATNINSSISKQTTSIETLKSTVDGLQSLISNLNSTVSTIEGRKRMHVSAMTNVPSTVSSGKAVVSPTGTQLKTPGVVSLTSGVYIKSNAGNSATVFVGDAKILQSASNGYPLEAGEQLFLAVDDPGNIYAISSTGSQVLHFVGS